MPGVRESEFSPERVAELWRYDPETGLIYWRNRIPKHKHHGLLASRKLKNGYLRVRLNEKHFAAHRVAWCLVYGKWPEHEIDHINRNPSDNRIQNLRDVVRAVNMANRVLGHNRDGLPTHVIARYGRFLAQVGRDKKCHYLGSFDDPVAAGAAAAEFVRILDAEKASETQS